MCTVEAVDGENWDISSHLACCTVFEEFIPFLGCIGHPGQEVGLVCPLLDIAQYVKSCQRCCWRHIGTYGPKVFAQLLPLRLGTCQFRLVKKCLVKKCGSGVGFVMLLTFLPKEE